MILKIVETLELYLFLATLYKENIWMSNAFNENFLKNWVTSENAVRIKDQKRVVLFCKSNMK